MLPDRVANLIERRAQAVTRRQAVYRGWYRYVQERAVERERGISVQRSRDRSQDHDMEIYDGELC